MQKHKHTDTHKKNEIHIHTHTHKFKSTHTQKHKILYISKVIELEWNNDGWTEMKHFAFYPFKKNPSPAPLMLMFTMLSF